MPSIETSFLKQKAVLWAANGYDDQGEVTVSAAVEISVRWEDKQTEALNTIAVDAIVVVSQDIVIGSIFWLGALEDIATPPVNLKQCITFSKIPDVMARNYRRVAGLIKYSNELPTIS